jgi:hypothetical protein
MSLEFPLGSPKPIIFLSDATLVRAGSGLPLLEFIRLLAYLELIAGFSPEV